MKIKYLGTAAYEGIPGLFCRCETCEKSRRAGGRNLRSRSQALVNDDLLLDFPPDTLWHFQRFGFDWSKIDCCLITHSHSDHFYPEDMEMAADGYCHGYERTLHYYAAEDAYRRIDALVRRSSMKRAADATKVSPFDEFTAGRYDVLALPASHAPDSSPLVYRISAGGKSLFYGHDTGVLSEKSFERLAAAGRLDLISLDCTGGLVSGMRKGHMCLDTCLEVLESMEKAGIVDGRTVKVINHFSHNGGATYEELVAAARPYGIIVSYDGLEIEF